MVSGISEQSITERPVGVEKDAIHRARSTYEYAMTLIPRSLQVAITKPRLYELPRLKRE